MPVWLTIVLALGGSALVSAIVNFFFNKFTNSVEKKKRDAKLIADAIEEKNEILKKGVQALLRHELYDLYDYYYKQLGYAPLDVKNDFENIYASYHNLGKNGVMDGIHKRFITLPEEPQKKQQLREEK